MAICMFLKICDKLQSTYAIDLNRFEWKCHFVLYGKAFRLKSIQSKNKNYKQ